MLKFTLDIYMYVEKYNDYEEIIKKYIYIFKLLRYCFSVNCVLVWLSVPASPPLHKDSICRLEPQLQRCAEL